METVVGRARTGIGLVVAMVAAALLIDCSVSGDFGDELPSGGDGSWWEGDGDVDADADADVDGDVDGDIDGDADGDWVPPVEPPEEPPPEPECNTEDEVVLYLSADDSNSMAGPVLARQIIRQGGIPSQPIRIYEFLNYYAFDYEAPEQGTVAVSAEMRPTDETGETWNLQIAVRAPDQRDQDRRPVNLTLSLDTSGSMSGQPIMLVRQSCLAIARSLREGDVISMVTWSTSQNIILESHAVSASEDPELVTACENLQANGGTDLNAGLVTAYRLARENFRQDRINRVVLMSDGGANVGVTDANLIAENADDAEGEAIYLMGVGMGSGLGYNDELMDTVTDAGKGAYIYVDTTDEAWSMFGDRFLQNVEIAARDVRVELTMPPTFAMDEFHGEEYSGDPSEVEPQHLAPNDAMIYHQRIRSCDPTAYASDARFMVAASFEDPFTREPDVAVFETTIGELLDAGARRLAKGDAIVAYAQALETLRTSRYDAGPALEDALAQVHAAMDLLGDDPDLQEIEGLLAELTRRY